MALGLVAVVLGAAAWWLWRRGHSEVRRPGEELPEITRKLELSLPESAPMPRLVDATEAAGLAGFATFAGGRTSQLPEDMGSGAAFGDYDGDGDDDLFLVAAGGPLGAAPESWAESMLFENRGSRFERVTAFPETRILGMAAAWGDADGDGRLDLAVSGYDALVLFRNTADGFVRDAAFPSPPGYWAGLSWGDFDGDRDLDLYVCGYVRYRADARSARRESQQYGRSVPYTLNPASFEPERNLLLENDGAGRFADVAPLWGVSNPEGRSLSALWHDLDGDGRLDLYVANDISDNALFLNRGDTFEETGLRAWVADYRGAMGLAAGDWNRDGDDDLFITHWMAQENALYDSRLTEIAALPEGAPRPPLTFADRSAPLGLGQPALQSVGWGTEFADFDGDGWLDLVVANGSTFERAGEGGAARTLEPQPAMLFWNERGNAFHDLAPLAPELAAPRVGRGLAVADTDGDGDRDVLLVRLDGGAVLLANEMQEGNWVEIRLRSRGRGGEASGRGEGSTVALAIPGATLRRTVGGASYLSQSSASLHFGLGSAAVEGVEVRWLGGETESFAGVLPGSVWELVEGEGLARPVVAPTATGPATALDDRERQLAFWAHHRAGMDRLKKDGDCPAAIASFRAALELDPRHEDARYYLANCLAELGETAAALAALDTLRRVNPLSHRGHKQWGVLRARTSRAPADLAAAEVALERALEINREETGSLLVLGELALLTGRPERARELLEKACRTNPQAAAGFFFRAYLAWADGKPDESAALLAEVRRARGPEWKPEGAVAEGDTGARMHRERTPLSRFAEAWDGTAGPEQAFAALAAHLSRRPEEGQGRGQAP